MQLWKSHTMEIDLWTTFTKIKFDLLIGLLFIDSIRRETITGTLSCPVNGSFLVSGVSRWLNIIIWCFTKRCFWIKLTVIYSEIEKNSEIWLLGFGHFFRAGVIDMLIRTIKLYYGYTSITRSYQEYVYQCLRLSY